jgi:hypothetical protein
MKEGEVSEESNMQKLHIANSDRPVTFYVLDVIISWKRGQTPFCGDAYEYFN